MPLFDWLRRRKEIDNDVAEEIRSHLAMAEQERVAEGADPQTARLGARKDFGNVLLATEDARREWRPLWFDAVHDFFRDIRFALHLLTKSQGFSLIVIVVLALGIGLNASVFTLFKDLALKPLAGVRDSGALSVIVAKSPTGRPRALSYPDYRFVREHDRAFSGIAGSAMTTLNVGLGTHGQRVIGEFVTGNYFSLFGVPAQLGRVILPSDEVAPGKHPAVVLSDGLWRRSFGGDPTVIGRIIHVNAYPLMVIGVADASFHGSIVSFDSELFIPVMMVPQVRLAVQATPSDLLHDRTAPMVMVLGRLRPGVTREIASDQVSTLSDQLAVEAALDESKDRLAVVPIWQSPFGAQTYMLPAVTVLGAMGALLLLTVSANIAGLVLVRGVSRRGEIALRLALGASRTRILRLLFIENLMLAVPGTVLGLVLAWYALPLIWGSPPTGVPVRLYFDVSVDRLVIGYAAMAGFASALFFGFVPALRASRVDLASVIKDDFSPRGSARGRFRATLVVSQVAVSLLLLVGAGLVSRSLDAARHADTGFDARDVISVSLDPGSNGYDESRARVFYQKLLDAARADQGVESAALATVYPMTMVEPPGQQVIIEGYLQRRQEDLSFPANVVSPDYFRTLRIELEAGREFARRDDLGANQVAIVNGTFARRFWGNPPNAVGKRIRIAAGDWRTIIGVARDLKYFRINETPTPYVYLPFAQSYRSNMILHTRGPAGTDVLLQQSRSHVRELDAELPILDAKTLSEQSSAALTIFEMTARALLILGLASMGLAAMGIYGLVSYTVKQSTHEIGIRMALGAERAEVVRRFLGRGLRLGAIGAAAGLAIAFAVTRLLQNVLFGVSATDAVSFVAAPAVVLSSTLVATLVPAWRAARTDPMAALRHQ